MEVIAKTNLRVTDLIAEAQPRVTEVIMEVSFRDTPIPWRLTASEARNHRESCSKVSKLFRATAKKNESEALASKLNSFASDEDLSEKELNTFASDEDLSEEEEEKEKEEELDLCFEKVARDGDISPRQRRSGSRKNKKKTHGRQHS
ncbi:hypothetical protein FXO38_27868 [Capsicum annuum]|nr:hypothetical protein FXO38_27868 [Capsicum annuum]